MPKTAFILEPRWVRLFAFLSGGISLITQALVLRELNAVFYGNELSYAVTLAVWLFWIGIGSLLTNLIPSAFFRRRSAVFAGVVTVWACSVPAAVFGARLIKPLFDFGPGEILGILPLLLSGLILTGIPALLAGAMFVILYKSVSEDNPVRTVYIWEAAGSGVCGILLTFLLFHILSATSAAWLSSALLLGALFLFYRRCRPWNGIFFISVLILAALFFYDHIADLNQKSEARQWPYGDILAVSDSPYGRYVVMREGEQVSLFENGRLAFTVPDALSAEEQVHWAMLSHPDPQRVLLAGGGLGGEIAEVLKHDPAKVDILTLDPQKYTLVKQYLSGPVLSALRDPRTQVILQDARWALKTRGSKYDVVLVLIGDPHTAAGNRYYTEEFYREVRDVLRPGGVLGFQVSAAANYLNTETRLYLRSLMTTLRRVFPAAGVIPGETATFLASAAPSVTTGDPDVLISRMQKRNIHTRFLLPHEIRFRTQSRRGKQWEEILDNPGLLNTDLHPRSYFFNMTMWMSHFDAGLGYAVGKVRMVPAAVLFMIPVLVFLGAWLISRRTRRRAVSLAVTVSGWSEIIFEIVVILAFQALYGIAYQYIGLILASFMIGLLAGAVSVSKQISRSAGLWQRLRNVQCGMILYPLVLPLVFILFSRLLAAAQYPGLFYTLFACLPVLAGFLGGRQFILADSVAEREGDKEQAGGWLYALDVLGASVGALLTGAILIPVYGVIPVCLLCAGMNAAVWLVLRLR
ncbi:MAG: hypothetical protein ACLFPX_01930 [Candidatus Omnitrophota bacterium]